MFDSALDRKFSRRAMQAELLDAETELALAHACPGIKLYAIDVDDTALDNTRDNVAALDLGDRVGVLRGELLAPVPPRRPIDVVVSNPPYIATAVLDGLQPEVAEHEPRRALDGGPDGLAVYRRLVPMARQRARIGLALEIGHDQGPAVAALFRDTGFAGVTVLRDLGGRDRVVLGTVPGARWPVPISEPEGESVVELDGATPAPDPDAEAVVVPLDEPTEAGPLDEAGEPLPVLDADR